MPRSTAAYLADIVDACDAVAEVLAGVDLETYCARRSIRSVGRARVHHHRRGDRRTRPSRPRARRAHLPRAPHRRLPQPARARVPADRRRGRLRDRPARRARAAGRVRSASRRGGRRRLTRWHEKDAPRYCRRSHRRQGRRAPMPTYYLGLDVHKVRTQYCLMDPAGEILAEGSLPTEEVATHRPRRLRRGPRGDRQLAPHLRRALRLRRARSSWRTPRTSRRSPRRA